MLIRLFISGLFACASALSFAATKVDFVCDRSNDLTATVTLPDPKDPHPTWANAELFLGNLLHLKMSCSYNPGSDYSLDCRGSGDFLIFGNGKNIDQLEVHLPDSRANFQTFYLQRK